MSAKDIRDGLREGFKAVADYIEWSEEMDRKQCDAIAGNGWLPIETAPKGRPIMVADGQGGMAFVEWFAWGKRDVGGRWSLIDTGDYASNGDLDWDPTHWAERPEGPHA